MASHKDADLGLFHYLKLTLPTPSMQKCSSSSNFISKVSAISQSNNSAFPYQKLSEDSPSSSSGKGHLSSHLRHRTPHHCYLSRNPGRARSSHCCCSFLHCAHHQTRSWSIAGSSCRQLERRAEKLCCSLGRGELGSVQQLTATRRAVASGPAVSELSGVPLFLVASRLQDAT